VKLVNARRGEIEAAGVDSSKISVIGNRWEGRRLTKEALEKTAEVPMYAAMPNDYLQVKNAAMESRLVSQDSAFGRACVELAHRVANLQAPAEGRIESLFRKFGKG
jgi:Flp pilus assembly CpaE family ATPase